MASLTTEGRLRSLSQSSRSSSNFGEASVDRGGENVATVQVLQYVVLLAASENELCNVRGVVSQYMRFWLRAKPRLLGWTASSFGLGFDSQ